MSVAEKSIGTRTRDGQREQRVYIIKGQTTPSGARGELLGALSTTISGYELNEDSVAVEEITASIYLGTAQWTKPPGTCSFQFDISVTSQHITVSKETVGTFPGGSEDFKKAIGVSKENGKQKVEGCDIEIPVFAFTVTKQFDVGEVDSSYIEVIRGLIGKVNNGSYSINGVSFSQRELLFVGASGGEDENGKWNISFKFAFSESFTNQNVAGIDNVSKKGWDYLWVRYEDVEDTTAYATVKRGAAVYVERVYDEGDFSGLTICS